MKEVIKIKTYGYVRVSTLEQNEEGSLIKKNDSWSKCVLFDQLYNYKNICKYLQKIFVFLRCLLLFAIKNDSIILSFKKYTLWVY